MWTQVKEAPAKVRELGLGGEPVYAASENAWYALSGDRVMRHPGVGKPDSYGPDYRSYALRRMQIPGLYGTQGLGGLQSANSPTTDANLLAAAQAVQALDNPCDLQGSASGNATVNAFQQAWNGTSDTAINTDPGYAQLTVDGQYSENTTTALSDALGGANVQGPCTGHYINPPGGGQPAPPPNPNPPTPTPAAAGSNYTVPILVGAGVVAAGLVGWAVFHKPKKKHVQHAARAAEEESRYHARRARRLREAAKSY